MLGSAAAQTWAAWGRSMSCCEAASCETAPLHAWTGANLSAEHKVVLILLRGSM